MAPLVGLVGHNDAPSIAAPQPHGSRYCFGLAPNGTVVEQDLASLVRDQLAASRAAFKMKKYRGTHYNWAASLMFQWSGQDMTASSRRHVIRPGRGISTRFGARQYDRRPTRVEADVRYSQAPVRSEVTRVDSGPPAARVRVSILGETGRPL
jgi:hypothetical protein